MKQKQTHRHRQQTCGCQEGWIRNSGLADANYYYRMNKQQGPTV